MIVVAVVIDHFFQKKFGTSRINSIVKAVKLSSINNELILIQRGQIWDKGGFKSEPRSAISKMAENYKVDS